MIQGETTYAPGGGRTTDVSGGYTPRDDSALYNYVINRLSQIRRNRNTMAAPAAPTAAPAAAPAGPMPTGERPMPTPAEAELERQATMAKIAQYQAISQPPPMMWNHIGINPILEQDTTRMTGAQLAAVPKDAYTYHGG